MLRSRGRTSTAAGAPRRSRSSSAHSVRNSPPAAASVDVHKRGCVSDAAKAWHREQAACLLGQQLAGRVVDEHGARDVEAVAGERLDSVPLVAAHARRPVRVLLAVAPVQQHLEEPAWGAGAARQPLCRQHLLQRRRLVSDRFASVLQFS